MNFSKKNPIHILFFSKFVSELGTYLNLIAIQLFVYNTTKSSLYTGMFLGARLMGAFVSSHYSGTLADRRNRKSLMIFGDLLRAALLCLVVFMPETIRIGSLITLAFCLGFLSNFFNTSFFASIPAMVNKENTQRENSIINWLNGLSIAIGSIIGGYLFGVVSYETIILIDAGTFLLSALTTWSLNFSTTTVEPSKTSEKDGFFHNLKLVLASGSFLSVFVIVRLIDYFGSASHNVSFSVMANHVQLMDAGKLVGSIFMMWAIGKMASSFLYTFFSSSSSDMRKTMKIFLMFTILMSLGFITIFMIPDLFVIFAAACLAGIGDGMSEITYNTALHRVSDRIRGRVYGIASAVGTLGFGLGMIVCGYLIDQLSYKIVVLALHGIPMAFCLYFLIKKPGKKIFNTIDAK